MTSLRGMLAAIIAAGAISAALLTLLGLTAIRPGQAAPAAGITVNGDLDTTTAGDGQCTLREAITNANSDDDLSGGDCAAGSGADTITFALPPSTTITLAGTQLAIGGALSIDGGTAVNLTVSGAGLSRIMVIGGGAAVTVSSMTLCFAGDPGLGSNPAILNGGRLIVSNPAVRHNQGGGIVNGSAGTLIVDNSVISSNSDGSGNSNLGTITASNSTFSGNYNIPVRPAAYPIYGGGIDDRGTAIVTNSTFNGNILINSFYRARGGGIANRGTLYVGGSVFSDNYVGAGQYSSGVGEGGGIYNEGSASINASYFGGNTANSDAVYWIGGMGGGIFNVGDMTIKNSTISGNSATRTSIPVAVVSAGGGIVNGGTLSIVHSTVSFNSVSGYDEPADMANGGGIANLSGGILSVINSTISGNSANGLGEGLTNGGGIFNDNATMTVSNSTIVSNTAVVSGTGTAGGGGINSAGTMLVSNSIIANSPGGGDCLNSGTIAQNLGNLVEDGSCNPAFSGDPLLGPLQGNGGVTWTHAPLEGSAAIDNGDNAICEPLDQRFVPRPIDGNDDGTAVCDIGSVEVGAKFTHLPVVMRTPD